MADKNPDTNPTASTAHGTRGAARAVVAVAAVLVIAFCAWSMSEYVNGRDPLAFLTGSDLLQTTAEPDGADVSSQPGSAPSQDSASTNSDAGDVVDASKDSVTQTSSTVSSAQPVDASASSSEGASSLDGDSALEGASSSDSSASSSGSTSSSSSDSRSTASDTAIVTVTVDGSAAGGRSGSVRVSVPEGASVYDALVATGANISATNTAYGTYVAAINGLAEREHGGSSGWVYAVNGTEPNIACSAYVLSAGDTVVWTYVNVTD